LAVCCLEARSTALMHMGSTPGIVDGEPDFSCE